MIHMIVSNMINVYWLYKINKEDEMTMKRLRRVALPLIIMSSALLVSGCASKRVTPEVKYAELTSEDKFTVSKFDFVLAYKVNVPDLLRQEELKKITLQGLLDGLNKAELYADDSNSNAKPLYVRASYLRRFVGDGTPIPTHVLAQPNLGYTLTEESPNGELLISEENDLTKNMLFESDFSKEIITAYQLGYYMAEQLAKKVPNGIDELPKIVLSSERMSEYQSLALELKSRNYNPKTDRSYIPDSVIEPLFTLVSSEDYDKRMDGYEEIQEQWLNSPKLFDYIALQIENSYAKSLSKDELEELEEQIKTISEAGLKEYLPVIEQVVNNATSPVIREYAAEAIEDLRERHLRSFVIHQPLPEGVQLPWKEHQLYNMTRATFFEVDDVDLQKLAVKEIYRNYLDNETLLDAVSNELEHSTVVLSHRNSKSTDYYAWSCRVLGMSGNLKYKPQLERISKTALSAKVREFAEEYAEEL